MPDSAFEDPRLAAIYDALDPDRSDLDVYAGIVRELDARSVLDIGCGTGTFACLLAQRGIDVTALDPAAASLDVARRKPGADAVRWIHGDVHALPPLHVDMAVMTGNVAQVFLTDEEWLAALAAVRPALAPGGHLVFETRRPDAKAWLAWTPELSRRVVRIPDVGDVESWVEVMDVQAPLVSFRWTYVFHGDGVTLTSDSTLRFRTRDEVDRSLEQAGYAVVDVRDAPDRPGLENVFVARLMT